MEMGQFKRSPGNRASQESVPKQPESLFKQWTHQAESLIEAINKSHQVELTEPGVEFSRDLLRLLQPQSSAEMGQLFEKLQVDLVSNDFQTFGNDIIMAHETSIKELSDHFSEFSLVLTKLPIPAFDKDLIQKRNNLAQAFSDRANQLLGK